MIQRMSYEEIRIDAEDESDLADRAIAAASRCGLVVEPSSPEDPLGATYSVSLRGRGVARFDWASEVLAFLGGYALRRGAL